MHGVYYTPTMWIHFASIYRRLNMLAGAAAATLEDGRNGITHSGTFL